MKKFLFVFQLILKDFLIFLFFFIWSRYFLKSLWLSLLVSAIFTFAIEMLLRFLSGKKSRFSSLKLKEKEEAENMFLSMASKPNLAFFERLAKSRHPIVNKTKKFIIIEHSEKSRTLLYPFLMFRDLMIDDLTQILSETKKASPTKLVIVCGQTNKECLGFSKNFDLPIVILDKFDTYKKLYKEYDIYPEITLKYKKDKSLAFRDLLALSFNKTRTKGYFISAVMLFFAGLIIRANLYYSIVASILVVFAFISQFNTTFNKIPSGEIL